MKLNETKSKYMAFSRSRGEFDTRLKIYAKHIERIYEMIHLEVWPSHDLTWDKHISEICRRAYLRVRLLAKLKYVGVNIDSLVELYCLLIRSLTEYCSTAFHSSLSIRLNNKLEAIQKTSLRVI